MRASASATSRAAATSSRPPISTGCCRFSRPAGAGLSPPSPRHRRGRPQARQEQRGYEPAQPAPGGALAGRGAPAHRSSLKSPDQWRTAPGRILLLFGRSNTPYASRWLIASGAIGPRGIRRGVTQLQTGRPHGRGTRRLAPSAPRLARAYAAGAPGRGARAPAPGGRAERDARRAVGPRGEPAALLVLPFVLLALAIGVSQCVPAEFASGGFGGVARVWKTTGGERCGWAARHPGEAAARGSCRAAPRARHAAALPAQLSTAPIPSAPLLVWIDEAEGLAAVVAADEMRPTETADLVATSRALSEIALVRPRAAASPRAPEPLTMAPPPRRSPLSRPHVLRLSNPNRSPGSCARPRRSPRSSRSPHSSCPARKPVSAPPGTVAALRLARRPRRRRPGGGGLRAPRLGGGRRPDTGDRDLQRPVPPPRVPHGRRAAPLWRVCTDVVVRAFRALGLDLQALVKLTGTGLGDPNIDHRRTETLRRFFARRARRCR